VGQFVEELCTAQKLALSFGARQGPVGTPVEMAGLERTARLENSLLLKAPPCAGTKLSLQLRIFPSEPTVPLKKCQARRAKTVAADVLLARPRQLDGHAGNFLRDGRGFNRKVRRQAPAKTTAAARQMHRHIRETEAGNALLNRLGILRRRPDFH